MEAIGKFIIGHKPAVRFVLAAYFIVIGTIGVRSVFFGTNKKHGNFTGKSRGFRFGTYLRELLFCLSDVVLGALILRQVYWAKPFGIALLIASTFNSARGFAWGFAKGEPSWKIYLPSLACFCLWNGFLIYVLYVVL